MNYRTLALSVPVACFCLVVGFSGSVLADESSSHGAPGADSGDATALSHSIVDSDAEGAPPKIKGVPIAHRKFTQGSSQLWAKKPDAHVLYMSFFCVNHAGSIHFDFLDDTGKAVRSFDPACGIGTSMYFLAPQVARISVSVTNSQVISALVANPPCDAGGVSPKERFAIISGHLYCKNGYHAETQPVHSYVNALQIE